jgi:hypothetical protein
LYLQIVERIVTTPLAITRASTISAAKTHPPISSGIGRVNATAVMLLSTPSCNQLTSGTLRRVLANSAQNRAMMFPNIGAAVITASSVGPA